MQLIKPLGELSLTASVLGRHDVYAAWAEEIQSYVWNQFDAGQRLLELLAARTDLMIAATVYAGLCNAQRRHTGLERFLRRMANTATCNAIQFPNWRRMDLEYGLEQLGMATIRPERIAAMWSSHRPEPWAIDTDSAYAMTHEVFYLSDFGRTPRRIPTSVRRYLHQWLPSWLTIFRERRNLDLYAELVMVHACIATGSRERQEAALVPLLDAVQAHGMVPGPRGGGVSLLGRDRSPRRKHFIANYHTTLVGLMALVLTSQGLLQTVDAPKPRQTDGQTRRSRRHGPGQSPHW